MQFFFIFREVFLNNEKLDYNNVLKYGKLEMNPKIRRVRSNRFFVLTLAPHSIGYFVLPGVRSPACIAGEEETDLIIEEIAEDQATTSDINFFEDIDTIENESRPQETKPELSEEINAQWYKVMLSKPKDDHYNVTRQFLIDRAKVVEKHRAIHEAEHRRIELKHKLAEKIKQQAIETHDSYEEDLELTSDEVKLIMQQRAKNKRPKRFLPIDVLMNFANKENQTREGVKRTKRQIDEPRFSRRKSSRRKNSDDMYSPDPIQMNPEPPINPDGRLKPIKVVQEADVFVDIIRDKNSKNPDYDYLDSEEFSQHQESINNDRQTRKGGRKRGKSNDDIHQKGIDPRFADGLDFYTVGEEENEWSIMDGDEQAYHYPGEMYEKTGYEETPTFSVKNDWIDYGELFEVDSLKDTAEEDESGYSDEAFYITDVMETDQVSTRTIPDPVG